jgi:hypothetical protein
MSFVPSSHEPTRIRLLLGAPDPRDGPVTEARRADKTWWSLSLTKPALSRIETILYV